MYAKLENNKLTPSPAQLEIDGFTIINPTIDTLILQGYKQVIFPDEKENSDMQISKTIYAETDDAIIITYEYTYVANINAKNNKIAEIDAYDMSKAVNEFFFNGHSMWYSKLDRVGLRFNVQDAIKAKSETVIWDAGIGGAIELPVAVADKYLYEIEQYALKCFNVTAAHKRKVMSLVTVQEVENYDYKTGYPAKLNL